MEYLTNIDLSEKPRVEAAAKASGMRVEFRDHPMPADWRSYSEYDPDKLVGTHGSIVTFERRYDHSKFWEAYRSCTL